MRKPMIALIAIVPLIVAWTWTEQQREVEAVKATLEQYFEGSSTGRADVMEKAFHPDARLIFMREGEVVVLPVDEWLARFDDTPADDEDQRERRIMSIDITGDTAFGKLELDYPDVTLIDYMTLLKTADGWKIVHKSFTRAGS